MKKRQKKKYICILREIKHEKGRREMICYTNLLKEELQKALGCTEPIAIAFGASYAVRLLGQKPERYEIACSGNIIKNVEAVTVPETCGMKG